MRTFLFAALFLFGFYVSAQDLNFQEYRKFLMSGNNTAKTKVAIQTNCTNTEGQVFRIGEKGFDTCMTEVREKIQQKQKAIGE